MHSFYLIPTRRSVVVACFVLCVLVTAEAVTLQSDKDALLALKRLTLANTNITWGTGDPCSDAWQGVNCSDQGRVTSLVLSNQGLEGQIPADIGTLSELMFLYLAENKLTGPIPPQIGNLSNLVSLDLAYNSLSEPIPAELGTLSELTELFLSDNKLTGPIPPQIGNLSRLTVLELSNNLLSESIPLEIATLSKLTALSLANNKLMGPIPPQMGNLSQLTYLVLSNNLLSQSIPSDIGTLSKLMGLYLANNELTGPIPAQIGNLSHLTELDLSSNFLSGSIPLELANSPNLSIIYLHTNNLTGSIPPSIGRLSKLETLDLQENVLTGLIPQEVCHLTRLQSLILATNNISGPIPSCLSNLSSLVKLYLFRNRLTGEIPPSLSNLSSLTGLYLQENGLSGSIPREFGNLPLSELNLGFNNLTGPIPRELGSSSKLTLLSLHHNQLTGPIPPEIAKLSLLDYLGLYTNQLSGPIPSDLGSLSLLTVLALSDNNLTGPIPLELRKLSNLKILELFGNAFTGSIPEHLGTLPNLTSLALNGNLLSGPIPPHLANLSSLTKMSLAQNNLTGSIPPELGRLSSLTTLDFSDNHLSGSIPLELGKLDALNNLNLSANALSGPIPEALGSLSAISSLDLSQNNLSDPIPPALAQSSGLTYLNLANNQLVGAIPQTFSRLAKLTTLLLSSNHLTESIPPELGNITGLESLSLSENNLTGEIPNALAILTAVVNLSSNSLSGSIPDIVKWDPKSDLSNNFLNGTLPQELASARVALNCLIIETGDYIKDGQRDSQTCSKFYSDVECPPCSPKELPGADGLCHCIFPLQLQAVFTANDVQSLGNFSVEVNTTLRQLAAAASLRPEQMALINFSSSFSPPTVNLHFLALPLARSSFPPDEVEAIRGRLSNTTNVTVPFFEPGFELLPDQESLTAKKSSLDKAAIAGIAVGTSLAVVLAASLTAFALWRHRQSANPRKPYTEAKLTVPDTAVKSWTFAEVQQATDNFNDVNIIGRGGFGSVYRGELAGVPVAVKRLDLGSNQGWAEFEKELKIIGTIHNRNLVRLLGYCIQGEEHLLVYEFMANGSLQDALFNEDGRAPLSWEQCCVILVGTANAIAYLHESCSEKIIHRDIKPANILLDSDYVAKVSDFGLAMNTRIADTHVSTNPKGTIGYLAPEYYASGQLTEKSDVYSFGMVMLVVISNKSPWSLTDGQAVGLSVHAFALAQAGREIELLAPRFAEVCDMDEARRFIFVALLCIQPVFQERPCMSHVVEMLSGTMDIPPIDMNTIDSFLLHEGNPLDSDFFFSRSLAASASTNTTNTAKTSSSGLEQ